MQLRDNISQRPDIEFVGRKKVLDYFRGSGNFFNEKRPVPDAELIDLTRALPLRNEYDPGER
jgi:hypothetical protein